MCLSRNRRVQIGSSANEEQGEENGSYVADRRFGWCPGFFPLRRAAASVGEEDFRNHQEAGNASEPVVTVDVNLHQPRLVAGLYLIDDVIIEQCAQALPKGAKRIVGSSGFDRNVPQTRFVQSGLNNISGGIGHKER
ncbi:MAG: hypothetical protein BWY82_00698 [Verrucomicrobia bacterium ADurb.Bin474]|nr:MAG: hypothetical protein BWY82_00698 [Verrucomicrobia bacterium ADurb.Bin474]